jgi:hypothetical protein
MTDRTFVCEIYEDRPEMCKEYPREDSYIPPSCTCEAACCRVPRKDGEPLEGYLEEISGGMPCKYLVEKE